MSEKSNHQCTSYVGRVAFRSSRSIRSSLVLVIGHLKLELMSRLVALEWDAKEARVAIGRERAPAVSPSSRRFAVPLPQREEGSTAEPDVGGVLAKALGRARRGPLRSPGRRRPGQYRAALPLHAAGPRRRAARHRPLSGGAAVHDARRRLAARFRPAGAQCRRRHERPGRRDRTRSARANSKGLHRRRRHDRPAGAAAVCRGVAASRISSTTANAG